jgi:diacylglycerol kinase
LSGVLALMLSMLGSWVSEKHWCQETLSKDIASATVLFLVFFNLFVSVALIRFWPLRAHAWS